MVDNFAMRVLVATDLSAAADEALRHGSALARAVPGSALAVCHVLPSLHAVRPLFPHLAVKESQDLMDLPVRAGATVTSRVEAVTGRARDEYELFVDEGVDYAEIVRRAESWRADRIVVGGHGHTGIARMLGGVAERVARYAPSAVEVVRDRDRSGCVVAATDLSDAALPAIHAGLDEAKRRGVKLVVLHAVDLGPATVASVALAPFGGFAALPGSVMAQARMLAEERIRAALGADAPEAEVEVEVAVGSPAHAVAKLAEERGAALVVLGTRGRTGLSRLLLGSTAERLLRGLPCSVLVVRLHPAD